MDNILACYFKLDNFECQNHCNVSNESERTQHLELLEKTKIKIN